MRSVSILMTVAAGLLTACQNAGELAANKPETALDKTNRDFSARADNKELGELDPVATATINKEDAKSGVAGLFASYSPPPKGSRFTWRSNWASMPPLVTYESEGTVDLGGKQYVRFKSVEGLAETTYAYYDAESFSLKGYRNADDMALTTFKPTELRYQFPLEKGKQWVSEWKMLDHKTGKVSSGGGVFKVMALEVLKLPAGTFQTARIRVPAPRGLPAGMKHTIWFAPKLGVTVKEQIGNGQMNWTQILEKVSLPADG